MAALEGRYHSEPFIGKSHATFSKLPPGPSAVKQIRALNNNEGKLQLGSLNRGYSLYPTLTQLTLSPEHLAADKPSSRSGEKYGVPITTIGIQQGAGSTQLSPPDDGNHGKGPQVSLGGVRPPGRGEPSEQPERREHTQLGSSDDQKRGEGPRGPSGGGPSEDRRKGRPDEQNRTDPSTTPHSQPPAPAGHTPATTEPPSERSTTSVPHRLPAPSVHAHTMTKLPSHQGRKDPFVTPPVPPVPPKHTPATTVPLSLEGHEDPSAIPHRLPSIPNGHASTVPEPMRPTRPPKGSTPGQKQGCWTRFKRWCAEHCCCCC